MIEGAIIFIFGLIIGSFLNVLIWRLNDEKAPKFWQGRSICPKCKQMLSWSDNIPLLSFLWLRGKCRYCQKKISWQYPMVELTSALTPLVILALFPHLSSIASLLYCFIAFTFEVIFFSDWIYGFIPDEMILVGSLFAAILNFKFQISNLGQHLEIGFFSALGFLLIVLATKFRGMGLGDVKLAFLMGFLLGWPKVLVAFWASFVLGGGIALILLVLKRKGIRDTIPLGPYLVIGTIIAALWSEQLLKVVGF